jgi:hypothetical protein
MQLSNIIIARMYVNQYLDARITGTYIIYDRKAIIR